MMARLPRRAERTILPVAAPRKGRSSMSSASWRPRGTATIRRLSCVTVAPLMASSIGPARRSSGRPWEPPLIANSAGTTLSFISAPRRRSTGITTRIRCGPSQPVPQPTLTREPCGPGNHTPDGSLSSRPPSSSIRPHGRSRSFAVSCPSAVGDTSSRRFATIGHSRYVALIWVPLYNVLSARAAR